ncbi:hypothetical protein AB0C52_03805 [Streptomyces sp. NPDC048717]|uniref:DUF6891 domain-containing protein n=1 Tax=Streptomyces sp. NPDC048717 TaxID=3154928 RepID=UPI0034415E95
MLDITIRTEYGERYVRPSARELDALVRRIGGAGDGLLVLQRVPDLPAVFAQVLRTPEGHYQLEHRAGAPELHFDTRLDDPAPVARALIAWARATTPDAEAEAWDAGISWRNMGFPPDPAVPDLPEDVRLQLEELVHGLLRGGYHDRLTLTERARDYLVDGDERPVSFAQAERLVDRLWRERVAEMAEWGEDLTDPERLTAAFAALDDAGIITRENYTCCRTCGIGEIGGEDGAEEARGYVFFHEQCTEGAAAGGALFLLYGGFDESGETTAAVGREVTEALRGQGLTVAWDGDPESAIQVTGLDWRKRLIG